MKRYVKTFESFVAGFSNTVYTITTTPAVSSFESKTKMSVPEFIEKTSKKEFSTSDEKDAYINGISAGSNQSDGFSFRPFTDEMPFKVFLVSDSDGDSFSLFDDDKTAEDLANEGFENYEFNTIDELEAFCQGLTDGDGWESIIAVPTKEFREYLSLYSPEEKRQILDSI